SAGHRSWQIRQPAAQSKLRELRQRARSACFVPVMQKMQNNRNFTLSLQDAMLCWKHLGQGRKRKTQHIVM
ncbi:MAG: hypothetical protein MR678_04640, partial [Muribaculaceae bacterium]|nr:hypothetical protein [Muribaculaceae bacterium]